MYKMAERLHNLVNAIAKLSASQTARAEINEISHEDPENKGTGEIPTLEPCMLWVEWPMPELRSKS